MHTGGGTGLYSDYFFSAPGPEAAADPNAPRHPLAPLLRRLWLPPRLRAFGEDFIPTRRVPASLRGRKNNNNLNKNQPNKESQAHVIRGLSLGMGSAALRGLPHPNLPKLALDCKRVGFLKLGARVLSAILPAQERSPFCFAC